MLAIPPAHGLKTPELTPHDRPPFEARKSGLLRGCELRRSKDAGRAANPADPAIFRLRGSVKRAWRLLRR